MHQNHSARRRMDPIRGVRLQHITCFLCIQRTVVGAFENTRCIPALSNQPCQSVRAKKQDKSYTCPSFPALALAHLHICKTVRICVDTCIDRIDTHFLCRDQKEYLLWRHVHVWQPYHALNWSRQCHQ